MLEIYTKKHKHIKKEIKSMNKTPINVRVRDDILHIISKITRETGITRSHFICSALQNEIDRLNKASEKRVTTIVSSTALINDYVPPEDSEKIQEAKEREEKHFNSLSDKEKKEYLELKELEKQCHDEDSL